MRRNSEELFYKTIKEVFLVIFGSFIFALGVNAVIIPNSLGEGGVTGLSLLLYYTLHIKVSITNLVVNGFLLVLGYKFLGKKTMIYTLISIVTMSYFFDITANWYHFIPSSTLIAAIAGGVLCGAGLGFVFLGDGTTAGSDILGMILKKLFGLNVSFTIMVIDYMVVIPLTIVLGVESAVVTLISLFVASQVLNYMLEGFNPKKSIMIVSRKYEAIGMRIQAEIGRGTTILNGTGFYSKEERKVLYVAVNRRQLMPIQKIIHEIDPTAFVTITDVKQVIGEGFTFAPNYEAQSITHYK